MQRAVFVSGLTSTEKLVLLAIVDHWSQAEPHPWPGVSRLEHWTGFGRRALYTTLRSLERKGALTVMRTPGIGNKYDLSAVCIERLPVHDVHPCTTITGASAAPDRCTTITLPVHDVHPKEPSKEPKKEPTESARAEGDEKAGAKRGNRKPGTRAAEVALPVDWAPSDAHRAFAVQHGLDLALEAVAFRGHFDGRTAASWNGRFQTWLANQAKWNKQRGGSRHAPVQQGGIIRQGDSSWLDADGSKP